MIRNEYQVPFTLQEEATYFLMEKKADGSSAFSPVTFHMYSADPTFVYVMDANGNRQRVPREMILEKCS